MRWGFCVAGKGWDGRVPLLLSSGRRMRAETRPGSHVSLGVFLSVLTFLAFSIIDFVYFLAFHPMPRPRAVAIGYRARPPSS